MLLIEVLQSMTNNFLFFYMVLKMVFFCLYINNNIQDFFKYISNNLIK